KIIPRNLESDFPPESGEPARCTRRVYQYPLEIQRPDAFRQLRKVEGRVREG
ncbi:MAG: hypothetical protein RLZZ209_852, partial [Bacteroidota bacterium]